MLFTRRFFVLTVCIGDNAASVLVKPLFVSEHDCSKSENETG
jgi:hypothetical protein